MRLFDGKTYRFDTLQVAVRVPRDVKEFAHRIAPVVEWLGQRHVRGALLGQASFVFTPEAHGGYVLNGSIQLPGEQVFISPSGENVSVLAEATGTTRFKDIAVPASTGGSQPSSASPNSASAFAQTSEATHEIDLLMVYANGNPGNIVDQVDLEVAEMNNALITSQTTAQVNVVAVQAVNYNQDATSLSVDLTNLSNGTLDGTGTLGSLKNLRDQYSADVVGLVVPQERGGYAGIADVPPVGGSSDAAFAVMAQADFGGDVHDVSHELGHLLGANHNPEAPSPGGYPFAYSNGKIVSGVARDIMSYTNACSPACPIALQYSNPFVDFVNHPGVSSGDTTTRNNARSINDIAPYVEQYRTTTKQPLVGDFDGDGISDVFWYVPGPHADLVWYGTSTLGTFDERQGPAISGTYIPLVGDFDGDGHSDIFWYAAGAATDSVSYGGSRGSFAAPISIPVNGHYTPIVGDFDGDGHSDIFWYAPGTTADAVWYGSTRGNFFTFSQTVNGTFTPLVGDFNGGGRSDIFWYAPGTTADAAWYGSGTRGTFTTNSETVDGTYQPFVGNFDGGIRSDIYWYGPGAAADAVWYGTPTNGSFTKFTITHNGSETPLVADFNGDTKSDIFWYGPGATADSVDYGTTVQGTFTNTPETVSGTYTAFTGNFNGGGYSDVFWYAPGTTSDSVWYGSGTAGTFTPESVIVG